MNNRHYPVAGRRAKHEQTRPPMSAAEARTFEYTSERNYAEILAAIEERAEAGVHMECDCEPYETVFTVPRWNAQGYLINHGEKAMRITTWVPVKQKEREASSDQQEVSEEPRRRDLKPTTAFLFCQCQVRKMTP